MAPASPQFEQVGTSSVYETKVAGSVGWAGYLLPVGATLPDAIDFDASLASYNGHYLFCTQRPAGLDDDPEGFAADALRYIKESTNNRAVVWLAAADPVSFGNFSQYGLPFLFVASVYQATNDLNLPFGTNATFYILTQTRLSIVDGTLQFSASSMSNPPLIGFKDQAGDPLGISLVPSGSRIYGFVPFSGTNTGCVTFNGQLDRDKAFATAKLGQGFQYAINDQRDSSLKIVNYGAFSLSDMPATLSLAGMFDLSDPANKVISSSLLQQGYLRSGVAVKGGPALVSEYRTAGGLPVLLTPVGSADEDVAPAPSAGGFAWASNAPKAKSIQSGGAYLALAGKYGLGLAGAEAGQAEKLMGGLFGSETLSFRTYDAGKPAEQNDLLNSIPSSPGYAPVFPFETVKLDEPASGAVLPRLTDVYQTSWSTLIAGAGPIDYSAEPEGSALYAPIGADSAPGAENVSVLRSSPPRMALAQGADKTFPLAPYGAAANADVDGSTLVQFESQILAPARKTLISSYGAETWAARMRATKAFATAMEKEPTYGTTPQGFIVQMDPESGAYLNVAMAQSTDADGKPLPFALSQPTPTMQDALQTNQLFLVAVNSAPFADTTGATFENVVRIAGWTMTANVGMGASATAYKNVLIMKFCSGTLLDRVTNPNRWTAAADFSLLRNTPAETRALSYTGLSQWLQNYIEVAITRAKGPSAEFYQNFAQIAQDPDWTGIIVLAADLSAEDLPPEIAGLAAGIDFTRFAAHHFGMTVSRVQVDKASGKVSMAPGDSSLFGLVDYEDPRYASNLANNVPADTPVPVAMTGDFDFTVLQLQSLFEHAKLAKFKSHVQLSIENLFGAPVTKLYNSGQAQPFPGIVLDGSYVEQNGAATYVFEQNDPNVLISPSNVLPAVAFNRVQFNTLGSRDDGATVISSFLIWGAFDFVDLKDTSGGVLDILSFGSPPDTPDTELGAGLAFSGLAVLMSFPATTPSAKQFVMDTDNLAWDLNASSNREASLFRGFGLQLKSFVNASGDQKPSDLGFLPVTSQLNLTELSAPWFGVVYEITLGGPGALASGMGFQSQLLAAWSPATTGTDAQRAIFIGMSLPGATPGASLFSIQGILRVAVGSISILRQPVPKAPGRAVSADDDEQFYCLRINDIGIKVFGIAKLPPSANIQFFLFGDPNNTGSLGWYAAYVADDNPGCSQSLAFAEVANRPELAGGYDI